MRFTQEQYEKATNVSVVEYLQNSGYHIKKKGRELCLKEHNSFNINEEKNLWKWHSRNICGSIIDLVCYLENKSMVEAVILLSGENYTYTPPPIHKSKETNKKLEMPLKNEDNKRISAYLHNKRGIDYEIINHLIKKGDLYEEKQKHNVCFIGRDKENNPKYAYRRSTLYDNSFKGEALNSDKSYSFKYIGRNTKRIYVFESPIDLLSHMMISKYKGKDFKEATRISLGGLDDKSLEKSLKEYQKIEEIILFLDNDDAGKKASKDIILKYSEKGYKMHAFFTKNSKDLNEFLLKNKEKLAENSLDFSQNIGKIVPKIEKIENIEEIENER